MERDELSNKYKPLYITFCCLPDDFGTSHLADIYFHAHSKRMDDLLPTSVRQGT
jgi:hypothetical protein